MKMNRYVRWNGKVVQIFSSPICPGSQSSGVYYIQYTPHIPDRSGVWKISGLSEDAGKQKGEFLKHEMN